MSIDALIVGGSFAGLSAAMQLARGRRTVYVVDAGQPRNRFADASHGFFGQDGAAPRTMIDRARAQLLAYPTVTIVEGVAVSARKEDGNGVQIELATGETLSASGLILATGLQDVLPDLPGLQERWGASVLHCPYCHGYEVAGRRLGVLNVMPASIHQALLIPDWGPTTFFLNGADEPEPAELEKLRRRGVVVEPERVVALEGNTPKLRGVRLEDGRLIELDALFIAPTTLPDPLAQQLGCELEEIPTGTFVQTSGTRETSVPGVFAAGDVANPMSNATLASASGVMAGFALHRSLIFGPLD